jgi:hypothetical protein
MEDMYSLAIAPADIPAASLTGLVNNGREKLITEWPA